MELLIAGAVIFAVGVVFGFLITLVGVAAGRVKDPSDS